ncbi:MAG: DUF11 domain-containing protein, partial [bacterium]|nr:DUF11 domain-containing protein [bacterium]
SYGSTGSDSAYWSIQGQRFASDGTAVASEFQVNTYTTGYQWYPAVAVDADGDFVVVWGSYGSTGSDSNYGVHAQRFARAADLAITKDDGVTTAVPGQTLTYTIVASNSGPDDASPVSVIDSFPAVLSCSWTSVAAGGATGNTAGAGNLNDTLTMPIASSVTYTVTCLIDPAATGTLSNTATITFANDTNPGNNSATDVDTLAPQADLAVTMTDAPDPVAPGGALGYTIDVTHLGPSEAAAVTVTDTLPAGVTFVSASGTGWTCGEAGGLVTCTRPTLGVGPAPSITIAVTAPTAAGTITNDAAVAATTTDPNPANNIDSADTTISAVVADITIPTLSPFGFLIWVGTLSAAALVVLRRTATNRR